MSFTDAIREVFTKYAVFDGRSRRSEYWYFFLLNYVVGWVLGNINARTGSKIFLVLTIVFSLATLIPGIAVAIRRLHDIGKSGWWMFIVLIPIVGVIWLIVLYATDSQPGDNMYGPYPKA